MKTKIHYEGLKRALLLMSVIAPAASALAQFCQNVSDFDAMRAPLLPTGWVASQGVNVTGAPLWVTTRVTPDTAPNAAFSTAPDNILDNRLDTPVLASGPPLFVSIFFRNNYNLESGADGAVLEVSHPNINGGAFTDITDPAVGGSVNPGYNALITSASSLIAGRMAWTGNSGGYISTVAALGNASASGGCKVRFRLVSDNSGASAGWRIDTVSISTFECFPTPTPSAAPTATPIPSPCGSPNVIADSTFEAGTPWSNWTVQTSTNFGTPLCNLAVCGTQGGSPYGGDNWAWFGGANVPETATLGQNVTILAGGPATLSFVMRNRSVIQDVLNVRVDGTIVQSYPGGQFESLYSLRTIDLSAFADGGSHLILFEYVAPTTETSGYLVDNVFLTFGPECSSPTPTPTSTPSPTPTPPATATPTPSVTPSASPTLTPSPTATATLPPTPTPSPTATPSPAPAQALNISTRLHVETADKVMIGGFIVTGNVPKKVAIRGIGPSLGNLGLSDVLTDPTLELRANDGALLAQNDDWQDDPEQAGELTALGLALPNPDESGIVATVEPGAYTAQMAGKNQASGIGLVEIYDADPASASHLANISTRGFVRSGDNVMIGGFILGQGSGSANVVVRGIGPSLSQFGLSNVLADPTLELRDSNGALLVANDNWQDNPASASELTARGFALPNPLESGIFAMLPPGAFTAILAGKNGGVGLGLVELYRALDAHILTVTSTADSGPGSLRAAITVAVDGDTIQFDAALSMQAVTLTSGELVIDKNITIRGLGEPNLLTVWTGLIPRSFRIFHIMPGRVVTIEGLTIYGGHPDTSGGGILNDQSTLTINSCTVDHNFSGVSGGGISNQGASAMLTIVNSNVTSNSSSALPGGGAGGGISNGGTVLIRNSSVSGNTTNVMPSLYGGSAGGIYNAGMMEISNSTIGGNSSGHVGGGIINGGTMTITGSTVSANSLPRAGYGGGISNSGPLTITNSTVSGNTATFQQSGFGGGIYNSGPLTITNSTFKDNSSDTGHGGGIYHSVSTLEIGNTILKAGSSGANINVNGSGPATVISHGYNLSSDDGGGFLTATGDRTNTNPMLGPLQDNGGLTVTHALLTGSPAINAGDPNFTPPPSYDQRGPGYPRVVGGRIDVGSFELQP